MPSKQELIDFALHFLPILKFHDGERFFPVRAEYWLAHESTGTFGDNERGTALYLYEPTDPESWKTSAPAVSRNDISLDPTAGTDHIADRNWIARDHHFLDFGGWLVPAARAAGSFAYDEDAISSVVSPPGAFPPPSTDLGVSSSPVEMVVPEVYAEVIDAADLVPPTADSSVRASLEGAVALNYYYLYPILHHLEGGTNFGASAEGKVHEGQWECISLFFRPGREGWTGVDLRPLFVAYSQSWRVISAGRMEAPAAVRSWQELAGAREPALLSGSHPISFVALGTHANVFHDGRAPTDTAPPEVGPGELIGYSVGGLLIYVGVQLVIGGLTASPIGWVAVIVGAALIIIGALIVLFTWLCSRDDSSDSSSSDAGMPPPGEPQPDEPHEGNGTEVGAGSPSVGGSAPPEGSGSTPGGNPGTLEWAVRVVNMITDEFAPPEQYPPPANDVERPAWWAYTGMWGVRVDDTLAGHPSLYWGNGTRRLTADDSEHTAAYPGSRAWHNLEAVIDAIGDPDRGYGKLGAELLA